MKNKTYLVFAGISILIILTVALVAILGNAVPKGSSSDIRARAGSQNALKLAGVVASVDEAKGTVRVTGVQFAADSRSGAVQNLGDWTVTAPPTFNFASISPGMIVVIGVEASTFDISSHAVTAISLTPGN